MKTKNLQCCDLEEIFLIKQPKMIKIYIITFEKLQLVKKMIMQVVISRLYLFERKLQQI